MTSASARGLSALGATLLSTLFLASTNTLAAQSWGTWIKCDNGRTACHTPKSLFACTYARAVQLADRPPGPGTKVPYYKDCTTVVAPEGTFEVEPTKHRSVVYVKDGSQHVGYVPLNLTIQSVGRGQFPAAMQGVWLGSAANCREYLQDKTRYDGPDLMKITASQLEAHENSSRILAIDQIDRSSWRTHLHSEWGGSGSLLDVTFERFGDTLRERWGDKTLNWVLCNEGQPSRATSSGSQAHGAKPVVRKWGASISCAKGEAECRTSRSLFACNLARALKISAAPTEPSGSAPLNEECEVLTSDENFEIETTEHPRVVYAKEGTRHIGYVPLDAPINVIDGGDFPKPLHGVWLGSEASCRRYLTNPSAYEGDDLIVVTAARFEANEESSRILFITPLGRSTWQVDLHASGTGSEWLSRYVLRREGDRLFRSVGGASIEARYCADAPAPQATSSSRPRHEDYPAERYHGRIALPDFKGRDRAYLAHRSRITEAMGEGPNVAGRLVIIPIECGTGCQLFAVGDAITGHVTDFPIQGEDYPYLALDHQADSSLVIASWEDRMRRCVQASFAWTGEAFKQLSEPEVIAANRCPV